ncbi:hypothetical protein ACSVIJ_16960 [Pseudomonas sp. NCHU5208]|uniref:hypothetical protein n=1 Tax=unclassified Pseudomonas TaxID=196821 RepID=UPI003F9739F8
MKADIDRIKSALSCYAIDETYRPDGSVVLTVKHGDKKIVRVIEPNSDPEQTVRLIKFDMTLDETGEAINEAVKYCNCTQLPTYSREPIFRTRHARLWALRKITNP